MSMKQNTLPFLPQARWIWGGAEASPRNEWRCFRKTFVPDADSRKQATLHISADTRYVLFINGVLAGRGPVRSWLHEYSYDVYEVGHLLKPGTVNVIAVLVLHFGVATFYSLRGRGGLLAQLTVPGNADGSPESAVVTDSGWTTELHRGHDPNQPRMSVQHAFAERIDGRLWDDSWTEPHFDDSGWHAAVEIGPVGMEPWTGMMERDIPFLTEEAVYPARVSSLHVTTSPAWSAAADLKYQWDVNGAEHANHYQAAGIVATVVRMNGAGVLTIGTAGSKFRICQVSGRLYHPGDFSGEPPGLYLPVELPAGEHLLLFDVSGKDHGVPFRFALDANAPFEVISPLHLQEHNARSDKAGESGESPLVTVGPLKFRVVKDTDPADEPEEIAFGAALEQTATLMTAISGTAGLFSCGYPVKAVPAGLVRLDDTFTASIWKTKSAGKPVPESLGQVAAPNGEAAVVPLFEEGDTEFILDFGKQWSGYVELELDAPAGTVVDCYGFEHMHEGWRQDTYGLDNTLRYICREGRQSYISPVRRGFRYLMVTIRGAVRPVQLYKTVIRQSNYPVAQTGQFQCSDPLLNDIWEISRHTTRLCMEDTFVDCPAYEQTFWVGDSRNEALVNYYVFGAKGIVERCLRLVPGSRYQTPYYSDQVPSGWVSVIPNWTFFWVIACKEYADYTGNSGFAADMWKHVQYTLEHYWRHIDAGTGLFSFKGWNLLDWAPIDQPNNGIVAHQNMFLAKTLNAAAGLAEAANEGEQAELYRNRAQQLARAINRHLWSEENQAYVDCIHADGTVSAIYSMQTQVVSIICGIAEGGREHKLRRYLLAPPDRFVKIGSPFMSFFYYEALSKYGETGRMLDDIREHFGQMIQHGASTCWEMYPGFKENRANPKLLTRSHCHAWSAAPGYFLGKELLGVRGLDAGWSKVAVSPDPADLSWANGAVPLPQGGCIEVSWQLDEERETMEIRVSAPQAVDLEVTGPVGYKTEIAIIRV